MSQRGRESEIERVEFVQRRLYYMCDVRILESPSSIRRHIQIKYSGYRSPFWHLLVVELWQFKDRHITAIYLFWSLVHFKCTIAEWTFVQVCTLWVKMAVIWWLGWPVERVTGDFECAFRNENGCAVFIRLSFYLRRTYQLKHTWHSNPSNWSTPSKEKRPSSRK